MTHSLSGSDVSGQSIQDNAPTKSDSSGIEDLVSRALDAQVINDVQAEVLRRRTRLDEVLGEFYAYVAINGKGDPKKLLKSWGIEQ